MSRKTIFILIILVLTALAVSACFPGFQPGSLSNEDQVATQNAIILQAVQGTATTMAMQDQISKLQTQVAQKESGKPAPSITPGSTIVAGEDATPTPLPSATFLPTATKTVFVPAPTATLVPTVMPVFATATKVPTRTATPVPCNAAKFVADVTIPDGTVVSPGASFTKTWRLRNIGACTWTTNYAIVFDSGTQMSSQSVVKLQGNVAPNQVIDVSVAMKAPTKEGRYRSYWKMRDAAGVIFGLGVTDVNFFADIKVVQPVATGPLDFIARMCEATWTSGAGTLACPGTRDDARGYVLRINQPTLESGYVDDEPVLFMYPQMVTNGIIRGKYPAIRVQSGYHFESTIGCAYKATACDVIFRLDYQIGSGSIQTLKSWHEKYDKKFALVDVDLSSLAGKDVKFILTVLANGSFSQDGAQWLVPNIYKK